MKESTPDFSLESTVRRLSSLVRVLIGLSLLNILLTVMIGFAPTVFAHKVNQELDAIHEVPGSDPFRDFHVWPLEKQIDSASVILITEYVKSGDRTKSIIKEILKQSPNTRFYYKVGDEFMEMSSSHGFEMGSEKGMIVFLTGNPASTRYGTSYSGDRLGSMGGMTLDELRNTIKSRASKER
jgi:hypothetical protein